MIALQKPPNLPTPNVHRRHPSVPQPVVVQPTRTPGLLSLSKPAQRQQRPQPAQKAKQSSPKQVPAVAVAVTTLKPAAEIIERKGPSPSRGRQQSKPKEKQTRSASHSSVRSRRNVNRQPSPPILSSSQAEVPSTPKKPNLFNSLDGPLTFVRAAPPKLAARPSGKLAKRRQSNITPLELPEPSKSIPVPKRNSSSVPLSRSEPYVSHMPRKTKSRKPLDAFPICDDMTDAGDLSEQEDISPPVTPTPMRAKRYDDGPRTAPLTSSIIAFPPASPPSPLANKRGGRRHKRSPSEGVFAMSSDEDRQASDRSTGPNGLFGLNNRTRATISISREEELERQAAAFAAAYFASSTFQNSPSPDELPPPSF